MHLEFDTHAKALAEAISAEVLGRYAIIDIGVDHGNEVWTVDLYTHNPYCPECGMNPDEVPHLSWCAFDRTDYDYELQEDLHNG
jgi:hypothetical protein